MGKEIHDHKSCDHWAIVCHSTIPPGMKTIQAIWSFKCKCFSDGTLNKHKVCLCAHGGMHEKKPLWPKASQLKLVQKVEAGFDGSGRLPLGQNWLFVL
jgi:hypothetical protein